MTLRQEILTKDIMTPGARCIGENDTLATAARLMADLEVGSLPICGEDGKLKGMLTDRDIVVKAIANGHDPDRTAAEFWLRAGRTWSTRRTTCAGRSR
ncbi:CBS domain-containing protein [Microbacterium sp. KUDC0406]|uniref:CBS domain-containing protein n=1 Tax=Microbacterium sp. KUDC0406 TaxID=2909588 RepID=UPI002E3596D0|nr:CBS domain-containing protein [Microbacterium sp. KUDC0406]